MTRTALPGLRETTTSYEATSRTTTDPDGKATTQRLDAYGRVTSVERGIGPAITQSGCDLLGRLVSMQDPVGNAWSWQFDSLGRLWDEQDPDAGHKGYTYDDAGRLATMTDAKSQMTTLVYDTTVRRLQSRTNSAGTVNYTYGEARSGYFNVGQPTTVTSPSSVLQTDYDALGRAVRLRRTLDGTVYTVARSFDASGRLLSTSYPDGDVVGSLGYDEAGRLDTIPGIVSSITYDAAGRPLTLANQNATNTSWSYEAERQFLSRIQTTSPQGTIQDMQYLQYTDAGLLQQVTSPIAGEGWSYDYDDLNHLTSATNLSSPAENQSWTYDPADRITYNSRVGSYTYPTVGQARPHAPATVNGASFSYDPNGNLLTGSGRSLVWDANNRITQVTKSGLTASFTYDGDGERLKKTSSQGTSLYPLGDDYEITNGVITKYISVEGLGVIAKRVGSGAGATTYWLHTDRLGSIQAVTSSTGAAVYRRTYRPYGETLGTSGSHTESRGWIDQRNDGESGLTYLHARYFDPKLGQFLSPDPIGTAGGLNQYGYAFGNPPNGTDRSGLDCNGAYITVSTKSRHLEAECRASDPDGGGLAAIFASAFESPYGKAMGTGSVLFILLDLFSGSTGGFTIGSNPVPQPGPPEDRGAYIPDHPTGPPNGATSGSTEPPVAPTADPNGGSTSGGGSSVENPFNSKGPVQAPPPDVVYPELFDNPPPISFGECVERNTFSNVFTLGAHAANTAANVSVGETGRYGVGIVKSHPTSWQHVAEMKGRWPSWAPLGGKAAGRLMVGATIAEGFWDWAAILGCAAGAATE